MFDYRTDTPLGRIGVSHDLIVLDGRPYLERWILWLGIGTVRLHRFLAGDDDSRGPHDHPWWFVTVPSRSYMEWVPDANGRLEPRRVGAWRPHFRSALHRHLVEPDSAHQAPFQPFWSLVITGAPARRWGFWQGSTFTPDT